MVEFAVTKGVFTVRPLVEGRVQAALGLVTGRSGLPGNQEWQLVWAQDASKQLTIGVAYRNTHHHPNALADYPATLGRPKYWPASGRQQFPEARILLIMQSMAIRKPSGNRVDSQSRDCDYVE